MLDENKYKSFTEGNFISDPYFQDWVINTNVKTELFWKNFFENNPHKKEAGEIARNFLINIRFKEELPDESLIERSLTKHLADIERLENNKIIDIRTKFPLKKLLTIAAVFGGVLLIISALFIFNKKDNPVIVKTKYGNIKSVVLPDSSLLVLNANSTVKFNDKWGKSNSREVWLQGEAFFNIRHLNRDTNYIKQYEQFIVHTEDLIVEVLGTSFDIRQRRGKTEVVLETGKIKVSFKDKKTKDIIMKPGDILAYSPAENKVVTETTSAEDFSAWKEKKLILNDPTAAEIVEYLEDNFGKKIILQNAELGKRKIEGPILLTNLDDALFILSTVLNTEIIRKDNTIIIRPR
jgi:ferric-dicitrate binding protein FerR (iron transport regulator)